MENSCWLKVLLKVHLLSFSWNCLLQKKEKKKKREEKKKEKKKVEERNKFSPLIKWVQLLGNKN